MKKTKRTSFFAHCWGVFEGGGVRGAALAGAYEAATEAGVTFGRVAGTSAGSIVAALIAAGGKPDFILNKLYEKEFTDFLQPPDPTQSIFENRLRVFRVLKSLTVGVPRNVLELVLNSGIYSSIHIQEWIEDVLKELIARDKPEVRQRAVRFRDLPLPLHIVASDILQASPKIWTKEDTPDDSVAEAVRCSCTIPFYFQAIQRGTSIYIDGGVLSNLPAFVFAHLLNSQTRSLLSRVICFRLIEEPNETRTGKITNLIDYGSRLGNTVVSGATQIQLTLQPDVYFIPINAGRFRATDFAAVGIDQKKELRNSGYQAMQSFIRNERQFFRGEMTSQTYKGFDAKLLLLVQLLPECHNSLWISTSDTYWLFSTFPSLLSAARRGVSIVVVTKPLSAPEYKENIRQDEHYRRWLLRQLGAQIHETVTPPFDGFLFDSEQETGRALIGSIPGVIYERSKYTEDDVKLYYATLDFPVIASLRNLLQPWHIPLTSTSVRKLPFQVYSVEELYAQLRNVPQYRNAKPSLQTVEVDEDLLALQSNIKEFKLVQIHQLIDEFHQFGVELFHPQKVVFGDGTYSVVTPPVLERTGDKLVIIEGHTRIFYCLRNGYSAIKAIVVEDVQAPLPGRPFPVTDMKLTSVTVEQTQSNPDYDHTQFRRIEEKLHSWPPLSTPI